MGRYYYYSPEKQRYYPNVFSAVTSILLDKTAIFNYVKKFQSGLWVNLTNPNWCEKHEDEVCVLLNLYRTRTKWKIEVKAQEALLRMISYDANKGG